MPISYSNLPTSDLATVSENEPCALAISCYDIGKRDIARYWCRMDVGEKPFTTGSLGGCAGSNVGNIKQCNLGDSFIEDSPLVIQRFKKKMTYMTVLDPSIVEGICYEL